MSPDSRMTIEMIRAIARDHAPVAVSADTRAAVAEAHQRIAGASGLRAYGRTTGVGFNRTTAVPAGDTEHGMRLLRSHAVEVGAPIPGEQVRAMLAVRLNQLSIVGSGIRPDILDGVAGMLNEDALPTVHELGASIGTADLSALARTALTLTGELPASRPLAPLAPFGADSALPFMSSSALTIGRAALAAAAFRRLESASIEIFALTAFAVGANAEHWSAPAAEASASAGVREVSARIRRVFRTQRLPSAPGFRTRSGSARSHSRPEPCTMRWPGSSRPSNRSPRSRRRTRCSSWTVNTSTQCTTAASSSSSSPWTSTRPSTHWPPTSR